MNRSKITYSASGVDYQSIDPLKKLAQKLAKSTSSYSDVKVVEESRGETAFVWEETDCYRAFVLESLGTKNLIADEMQKVTGRTYYNQLAQDTVAMIINDLIAVGANPQVINAYFAAGSSNWFANKERVKDLTEGWANACKQAACIWGGGESPSLSGIINPDTGELAGSAIGIIKPKDRLTLGNKIRASDAILLIESSGIHSNGVSLVRKISKKLADGFSTKLPNGQLLGEAVLTPTHIYSSVVQDLFENGVNIHYMVNITGHGWRKLMRAKQSFTYDIFSLPPISTLFDFIQEHSASSDEEMYGNFNMGAGFAVYLSAEQVDKAMSIIQKHDLKSWNAGVIKDGERKVKILPKNITFNESSLDLR